MHRVLFLVVLGVMGCPNANDPKPPQPSGSEFCQEAAHNAWDVLHCPWAKPTTESFAEFCVRSQGEGVDLYPQCIAQQMKKCEEVDTLCKPKVVK
jgi:hypothetical protein